jgi:hypothetical protein
MLEFWAKVFVYAFEAYALIGVVFAAWDREVLPCQACNAGLFCNWIVWRRT